MELHYIHPSTKLNIPTTSLALGNFDGVHKGHKHVIAQAKQVGLKTGVVTFEPHPQKLFRPDLPDNRLTPLRDKLYLLNQLTLDYCFVLRFNKAFAKVTAPDFINKILLTNLNAKKIVTGFDFNFGYNRQGNTQLLASICQQQNIEYLKVQQQRDDITRFSSSNIRQALKTGNIKLANHILGYKFFINAKVIHGDKRGRTIGFATANLKLSSQIAPKYGVYKVTAELEEGTTHQAIANFGIKPTVNGIKELLEVHILNFNQNIYGKRLKIHFEQFIRAEQKFDNLEQLKKQIQADISAAYNY